MESLIFNNLPFIPVPQEGNEWGMSWRNMCALGWQFSGVIAVNSIMKILSSVSYIGICGAKLHKSGLATEN